jgi:hypothetical protein
VEVRVAARSLLRLQLHRNDDAKAVRPLTDGAARRGASPIAEMTVTVLLFSLPVLFIGR